MEKDTFKTKVLFLMEKQGEEQDESAADSLAYFPEILHNEKISKDRFTCYSHVGQHSSCHSDYVTRWCKEATKEQAADLMAELESIGYNLEILNKW